MVLVAEIVATLGVVLASTDGTFRFAPAVTPPAVAYSTTDAIGVEGVAVETAGVDVADVVASTVGVVVVDVDCVDADDAVVVAVGVGWVGVDVDVTVVAVAVFVVSKLPTAVLGVAVAVTPCAVA